MTRKHIIEHVSIEVTVDAVEPPPPNIKSTFNNLHDWLTNLCNSEKPQTNIAHYEVGVFESAESRVLYIIGINKYTNPNHEKIEFERTNMYLLLPIEYYETLTREELADTLAIELRMFTLSSTFNDSYLVAPRFESPIK